MKLTWTDERVEALKKLWEAGLSASQIAAELSAAPFQNLEHVSRNSAIGKIHRLGLSGRTKGAISPKGSGRPKQYKTRPRTGSPRIITRASAALAVAFEVEPDSETAAIDNVIPMQQRLTLLDLDKRYLPLAGWGSAVARFLFLRRSRAGESAVLRSAHAPRDPAVRGWSPSATTETDEVSMSESSLIKDYARKECLVGLMKVENEHGKAVTNLVVDANLEAIAIYLKGSIGAEAAFNVLTRHADEIIRPVLAKRVVQR